MNPTIYRMEFWEFDTAEEMSSKRAEVEKEGKWYESYFNPDLCRYWLKIFEKAD